MRPTKILLILRLITRISIYVYWMTMMIIVLIKLLDRTSKVLSKNTGSYRKFSSSLSYWKVKKKLFTSALLEDWECIRSDILAKAIQIYLILIFRQYCRLVKKSRKKKYFTWSIWARIRMAYLLLASRAIFLYTIVLVLLSDWTWIWSLFSCWISYDSILCVSPLPW